ncbi:MAG TPA: hypothetical protein VLA37_01505 [Sphingomonadaceae bacterium]|nr:hypothetical protein [Sphingomonadaceae bacterium]
MNEARQIEGWKLSKGAREDLLGRFPPRYSRIVADHVTFKPGPDNAPMPEIASGLVVGRADDASGVEALVVAIGGTTGRPDGSTWHITWSLEPGRRARESNDVIAEHGWKSLEEPIEIALIRESWLWKEDK